MSAKLAQLLDGIEPVCTSRGGEGYYSLVDSLEIVRRCTTFGIAATSPEAFELLPGEGVRVIGVCDFGLDTSADWSSNVGRANQRAAAYVESFRDRSYPVALTWVVFTSIDDADVP